MHKIRLAIILFATVTLAAYGENKKPATTEASQNTAAETKADSSTSKIALFFGDSITAGYGLDDPSEAFPGVVQNKINEAKLHYKVVNAGVSGETSAGGKARIGWILKQKVDVFVL